MDNTFNVKIYSKGGAFKSTLITTKMDTVVNFDNAKNNGLGEFSFNYFIPVDTEIVDHGDFVKVYKLGALIYTGYVVSTVAKINTNGEYWAITCMGIQSKLSEKYYTQGSDYNFTRTKDPAEFIRELFGQTNIDSHNLSDGLMYYWSGDDNADVADIINDTTISTTVTGATKVACKVGDGYEFEDGLAAGDPGTTQIALPSSLSIPTHTGATISFRAYIRGFSNGYTGNYEYKNGFCGVYKEQTATTKNYLSFKSDSIRLEANDNVLKWINHDVQLDSRHNYTITFTSTGIDWYVDGKLAGQTSAVTQATLINIIGKGYGSMSMDGMLDEMGFWDRALTKGEAELLYNKGRGTGHPFSSTGIYSFGQDSIQDVGTDASLEFNASKRVEALNRVLENTSSVLSIRNGSDIYFGPVDQNTNHVLTLGNEITNIDGETNSDALVNKVTIVYSDGQVVVEDTASQLLYGVQEYYGTDDRIKNESTATAKATEILNQQSLPKGNISLTVNDQYDIDTLYPGDRVSVRNSTYQILDKVIEKVAYNFDTVEIFLDDYKSIERSLSEDTESLPAGEGVSEELVTTIEGKAEDTEVVHTAGNETIDGEKTFLERTRFEGNIISVGNSGNLQINANDSGVGDFNLFSNATGVLSIFGSGGNVLDVKIRDGDLEVTNGDFSVPSGDITLGGTVNGQEVGDSGWITPTILNGRVVYGTAWATPQYRKIGDVVYIKGMIKNGTAGSVFTLPVGYRPLKYSIFTGYKSGAVASSTAFRIDVRSNGLVVLVNQSSARSSIECSFALS